MQHSLWVGMSIQCVWQGDYTGRLVGDHVSPNAVRQTSELQIFPIKYRNAGRLLTCCNQSVYADDCNSSVSCFFAKRGSSKLVSKCLFSDYIPIKTRLLCTYVIIKLNYCSAAATQLFVSKLSSDYILNVSNSFEFLCFKGSRFAIFTGLSQLIIWSSQIEVKLAIKYNLILIDRIIILPYYYSLETPKFFKTETWLHSSQQPFPTVVPWSPVTVFPSVTAA